MLRYLPRHGGIRLSMLGCRESKECPTPLFAEYQDCDEFRCWMHTRSLVWEPQLVHELLSAPQVNAIRLWRVHGPCAEDSRAELVRLNPSSVRIGLNLCSRQRLVFGVVLHVSILSDSSVVVNSKVRMLRIIFLRLEPHHSTLDSGYPHFLVDSDCSADKTM